MTGKKKFPATENVMTANTENSVAPCMQTRVCFSVYVKVAVIVLFNSAVGGFVDVARVGKLLLILSLKLTNSYGYFGKSPYIIMSPVK